MARDNLSFYSVWTVPSITHMMFVNLKDNSESQKKVAVCHTTEE